MIEVGSGVLLRDHGPGAFQRLMQAGKRAADITHVFLSHLHFDHCGDLPRLVHHPWDAVGGLAPRFKIYGPPGTQEMMDRLFGPHGAYHRDLTARTSHPVSLRIFQSRGGGAQRPWPDTQVDEIGNGAVVIGNGWRLEAVEVIHHQPFLDSLGYRITAGGKVLGYTSDVNAIEVFRA